MNTPQSFDPLTGKTKGEKSNGSKIGIIAAVIGAIVAFAVILVIAVINLNPTKKVFTGISKTLSDFSKNNALIGVLNFSDITSEGEYTAKVDVKTEITQIGDINIYSEFAVGKDAVGATGYVDLSYIPVINYEASLSDKQARVHTPIFDDFVFVYNYHEKNDGFLMNNVDTELLNDTLSQIYKMRTDKASKDELNKSMADRLTEDIKDIKFSSEKGERYLVNGKEHKCKGYSAVIDKKMIMDIAGDLEDIYENAYGDLWDSGYLEDLEASLKDSDEIKMTVYMYKKEPAVIIFDDGKDLLSINFEGGSFRAQSFKIFDNNEETFSYNYESDNGIEKVSITGGNAFSVDYSYETASGDLKASVLKDYRTYDLDMNIIKKDDSLKMDLGIIDLGDTYIGGSIVLSKGAEIPSASGTEINIGQCTEMDLLPLLSELQGLLSGMIGW